MPSPARALHVQLQHTVGAPIAESNKVCTAEPRALIYGTQNYKAGQPLTYVSDGMPGPGYWLPANAPSALDLLPAPLAGDRTDLCVGFTLPPNVESGLIRTETTPGDRVQDAEPWPDLHETHVAPDTPGDPAPQGDDLRSFTIDLPVGTGLALGQQGTCADGQFKAASLIEPDCPASSRIGDALVRMSLFDGSAPRHVALHTSKLYLLEHGPNAAARIGLVTPAPRPGITPYKAVLRATLLPSGRLRLIASDLPRSAYAVGDLAGDGTPGPSAVPLPIYVESVGLRFYGSRGAHPNLAADLASTTTSCAAAAAAEVSVATYMGATDTATPSALAAAGCAGLDYAPTLTATLTDRRPGVPTGATFTLGLSQMGDGQGEAGTATAMIALPSGLRIGEQFGSGAPSLCAAAAFARESDAPANCPPSSRVGTVALQTTLIPNPLTGHVHLGAPRNDGDLAALLVEATVPGATAPDAPRLTFSGRIIPADAGQLTIRFDELPVLPVGSIAITLSGGDHALLTTPSSCGPVAAGGTFLSHDGRVAASAAGAVEIEGDCAPPSSDPTVEVRAATAKPAARDGLGVRIGRPARGAALTNVSAVLPEGALLDLRGRASCTAEQVEQSACGDAAALGQVRLVAGAGAAPLSLVGSLLQVRANPGTLAAGLARVRVALGDLTLGTLTVPVAFAYDARARKVVVAAAVPTEVGTFPLDVRALEIELASGVSLNPTSCGPLPISAEATTEGGGVGRGAGSFTLGGCDAQPLAPSLRVSMSGDSVAGGRPRAVVSIGLRDADANLGGLSLSLPVGLSLDAARGTCEPAAFAVGGCGDAGRIGSVASSSSLESDGLTGGELSLVREPGRTFPSIGLSVGGIYGFRTIGQVTNENGRFVVYFDDIPDVPLTRLDLVFDGGSSGGLNVAAAFCDGSTAAWAARFTGQAGQAATSAATVGCSQGPPGAKNGDPVIALSVSAKTGLKLKVNSFGTRRLQSAKLTFPSRLKVLASQARRKKNASIVVLGATARTTFSKSSVALTMRGSAAPQEVVARLRWPAIQAKAKGSRTVKFRLRLAFTDGTVVLKTVSVKLPAKLPVRTAAA